MLLVAVAAEIIELLAEQIPLVLVDQVLVVLVEMPDQDNQVMVEMGL
jgi:hypothetical protein